MEKDIPRKQWRALGGYTGIRQSRLQGKIVTRHTAGHFIMTKASIYQDDTRTISNGCQEQHKIKEATSDRTEGGKLT